MQMKRSVLAALVFSLGLSPLAAEPMVQRGNDVFTTPADGKTSYDFAHSPVPAGFFCKRSKAFTGRVEFKGLPLATAAPGQLRGADTVVERLDDAVFNAKGLATTRLQFRALSLVSIAPIKTACGSFHAYVSLNGTQRVTTMNIRRTEEGGGSFTAPLAADVRLTFIPVKPRAKAARNLELTGSFTFPATPLPWSFTESAPAKAFEAVLVDTNGDLTPDSRVSAPSNFFPGRVNRSQNKTYCCWEYVCHTDAQGHVHCNSSLPWGCTGECP